jgi:glycosyltransferase involved in cell wall biosynthesis
MSSILIIGKVWPEKSTGAGVRMMQIIQALQKQHTITFASPALKGPHAYPLNEIGVTTEEIKINCNSFDDYILEKAFDIVIFDRFTSEEQFGWRVASILPNALRIIDSEDLHFLRKTREQLLIKKGFPFSDEKTISTCLNNDFTYREIASMLRSDMNLIISDYELQILETNFPFSKEQLNYLPLTPSGTIVQNDFSNRIDFVFAGNFLHQPNRDAIIYLKLIWKQLKSQLPDAKIHVFGAYGDEKILNLHDADNDFLIHGWVEDLSIELAKARILLAPLRFGAGIKSKILESFQVGTPVATTPIGSEGIASVDEFGGVVGNCGSEWISNTMRLYTNEHLWNKESEKGKQIIATKFAPKELSKINDTISDFLINLKSYRKKNFIQTLLNQETLQSKKYLSKWIQEKNSKINQA